MHASSLERGLVMEAAIALIVASIAIGSMPFRRLVPRIPLSSRGSGISDAHSAAIGQAVERASRNLPWRTVCFHEALAAQWMLRRRRAPAILHYGLSNGDDLKAHTWVSLDGRVIVGGQEMSGFHCVASFPASQGTTS